MIEKIIRQILAYHPLLQHDPANIKISVWSERYVTSSYCLLHHNYFQVTVAVTL